jgi:hypothetical protein
LGESTLIAVEVIEDVELRGLARLGSEDDGAGANDETAMGEADGGTGIMRGRTGVLPLSDAGELAAAPAAEPLPAAEAGGAPPERSAVPGRVGRFLRRGLSGGMAACCATVAEGAIMTVAAADMSLGDSVADITRRRVCSDR